MLVPHVHVNTNGVILEIGTLGYTPYAAGLYCVDKFGISWLLLLGSVILGISACFLWVASGAILLGYTEENKKGTASTQNYSKCLEQILITK